MRTFHVALLLFFAHSLADAQPRSGLIFKHFNTQQGLPSNQINALAQDEKGYIWIASMHGLIRYDGIRYKVFGRRAGDDSALPSNIVTDLKMDGKQRLWLLTAQNELGFFDVSTLKFHAAKCSPERKASLDLPKTLKTDSFGNAFLLLGEAEILVWQESAREFQPAVSFFAKEHDWQILDFAHQPGTQKYFAAVRGKGLAVFDRSTGQMCFSSQNIGNEAIVKAAAGFDAVHSLFFDSKNRLWFLKYEQGVPFAYAFDFMKNVFAMTNCPVNPNATDRRDDRFFEQSDGSIWAFGRGFLGYFLEKEKRFELIPPSTDRENAINYNFIPALLEDGQHNIWVATAGNGIFRCNPSMQYFSNISYPGQTPGESSRQTAVSLLLDRDSTVLASIWNDGLLRFDKNFKPIPLNIKGLAFAKGVFPLDMAYSPDKRRIWMGCRPGIAKYDPVAGSAVYFNPAMFENSNVRSVAEDLRGNLWLDVRGVGFFKWDAQKGQKRFEDGLSKFDAISDYGLAYEIVLDSKGRVWVGTSLAGVFVIDPATEKVVLRFSEHETGPTRLPTGATIRTILSYNDSTMAIATGTNILFFNQNTGKTKWLRPEESFRGTIATMQCDRAGNIWFGTTSNLYRVHPDTKVILSFDRYDGLGHDFFTTTNVLTLPGGRLAFASSGQIIVFDPMAVKAGSALPKITLTDLKVNDRLLPLDSLQDPPTLELPADENALTIEFSPLDFSGYHAIQYKMEGLGRDWVQADKDFRAVFSFLPPGEYRFLCRVFDTEMNVSGEQVLLTVKIRPHFWQSWWFYSLLVLLAGAGLFWFDRERLKRREAILKVRNKIGDELHNEVSTALQNINILSEMANLKADSDPEKAKEFIGQIHKKSRTVIDSMDDMLWGISPGNDSMTKTAERMQEFVEALNARHNSNIELLVEDSVRALKLDMRVRYEAFLLFKTATQGLLDASPAGFRLNIGLRKNQLLYAFRCESSDYNPTFLYNFLQRQDFSRRVLGLGAEMDLVEESSGYTFEIIIPTN